MFYVCPLCSFLGVLEDFDAYLLNGVLWGSCPACDREFILKTIFIQSAAISPPLRLGGTDDRKKEKWFAAGNGGGA